jgi:hypothetical protein
MITKNDIGFEVVDVVTGIKGVVTSWHEILGGSEQAGVTGEATGDKAADVVSYDVIQLERVANGRLVPRVDALPHSFALGDETSDTITGFTGKIVELVTFLNGCVYASLQPPVNEKKEFPDKVFLSIARLEIKAKAVQPKPAVKRPGGPMRAVMRR